jgi:hypothetical protein
MVYDLIKECNKLKRPRSIYMFLGKDVLPLTARDELTIGKEAIIKAE